jgi:hypothetical protein
MLLGSLGRLPNYFQIGNLSGSIQQHWFMSFIMASHLSKRDIMEKM